MNIGENILNLRKKEKLSQEQLAEKIGVTRQTISNWELGESSPDLKQAKELSKIFGVSLDDLTDNLSFENLSKTGNDKKITIISPSEKLAGMTIKILKGIGIFILISIILYLILIVTRLVSFNSLKFNNSKVIEETEKIIDYE